MQIPDFNNPTLQRQAFVHRSFLNEHKDENSSNERLEFLGDSIISFVVSFWLYEKLPDRPEGILTNLRSNLVNTKSLAKIANKLSLGDKLLLSRGEEEGGGRSNTSLLADTYEALVGALFIDQGLEPTKQFILESLLDNVDFLEEDLKDPKSSLQEHVQAKKLGSPIYKVIFESGPDHNKTFTVEVEVNGSSLAKGEGRSKREAEAVAALAALDKLNQT